MLPQDLEESSGVGGQQHIYPVLNVSKVSMISAEASILLCKALQGALYAAIDYLENDADTSGAQRRPGCTPKEVSECHSAPPFHAHLVHVHDQRSALSIAHHELVPNTLATHSDYGMYCVYKLAQHGIHAATKQLQRTVLHVTLRDVFALYV